MTGEDSPAGPAHGATGPRRLSPWKTLGYRSHAEQKALYKKYGTGMAAKPGTSNHESGPAVDFANTHGAQGWLDKNTSRFGLKTNENEGGWERWHVSPTGH